MPETDWMQFVIWLVGMILIIIGILFTINRLFDHKEFRKITDPSPLMWDHSNMVTSKFLPPVPGCTCGCVEYAAEQKAKEGKRDVQDNSEGG